jgi:hypothetical protein
MVGRKRLCNRCAIRTTRGHAIGDECQCCGDHRRVVLVRREMAVDVDDIGRALETAAVTLCGSCAVVLGRKTMTLDSLRAELEGYERKAS